MQLSKEAEEFGADGLLVVTPYYNKATQAGLVSHYSQIADSTKCPIIVYNVPGRTGCNVLPETMAELFKTKENIVGLKEATLFSEVNPIPVKKAMNLMGMNVGPLRSPMCEMGEDNARKLAEVMKAYGLKLA